MHIYYNTHVLHQSYTYNKQFNFIFVNAMPKIYSILHSRCLKKRIKKKEERKMLKFSLCVYFDFRNSFTSHTKQQHNLESEKRTKILTRKKKKLQHTLCNSLAPPLCKF